MKVLLKLWCAQNDATRAPKHWELDGNDYAWREEAVKDRRWYYLPEEYSIAEASNNMLMIFKKDCPYGMDIFTTTFYNGDPFFIDRETKQVIYLEEVK